MFHFLANSQLPKKSNNFFFFLIIFVFKTLKFYIEITKMLKCIFFIFYLLFDYLINTMLI